MVPGVALGADAELPHLVARELLHGGLGAGDLLAWLPSAALGEGMRTSLLDGALPGTELLVLALWAGGAILVTSRTFRWE